jgi:uncharacterized alkaline shock family protein YloU
MATKTDAETMYESAGAVSSGLTLQTEKGVTTISDAVVAKLAGHACREIEGVAGMGTTFRRLLGRVRPGEEALSQGVNVEVGKKEAAVDVVILVQYGYPIPSLAQEVRDNVIARVESSTGLIVKEVNIEVDDLQFADDRSGSRVE